MYYFAVCWFFFRIVSQCTAANMTSYAGAQVWRVNLSDSEDGQAMRTLANDRAISLWNLNSKYVDFLVQADNQVKVNKMLRTRRLKSSTIIEDVQRTIDRLKPKGSKWTKTALRNGYRLNWKSYPSLEVIDEYLTHLATNFPSLCTVSSIGTTEENRPISLLRISNGNQTNKAILITAGIHAREWIAITSALYLIETIVVNFEKLPGYMKKIDWSIIPLLNPDGYVYSYTRDRLWRKNRRKGKDNCTGVDINRNFDHNWYIPELHSNQSECLDDYSGTHPFSEPESKAIRDLVLSSKKTPDAFIDVHSFGQLILYPWGSKFDPPADEQNLKSIALAMAKEIQNTTWTKYFIGNCYSLLYQASGTQADWIYDLGVRKTFVIELRDNIYNTFDGKGFLVPPEYIEPTGSDLVAGMRVLGEVVVNDMPNVQNRNSGLGSLLDRTLGKLSELMGL